MFIYIFTTYPLYSETFLQREQFILDFFNKKRFLVSLWGGGGVWNKNTRINVFKLTGLFKLPFNLTFWICREGVALGNLFKNIKPFKITYLENLLENLLGFVFSILNAKILEKKNFKGVHAAWSSAPSTSALVLGLLLNKPCSSGAHAYDIFQNKGDFLIKLKSIRNVFIHTSTFEGVRKLYSEVFFHKKIKMIRRGLDKTPIRLSWVSINTTLNSPIRLLSVGRLVEKKDYNFQINLLYFLKELKVNFTYTLIGKGFLFKEICLKVKRLGLCKKVNVLNNLTFTKIKGFYTKSDVFLFSGKVAVSGDRDGLPNVVPEAIAFGLPTVVSYIGGLPEFLKSNLNGIIVSLKKFSLWKRKVLYLLKYNKLYNKLRRNGYFWVVKNFNAYRNTNKLITILENYFK